jgi:hypothetical protein
MNISSISAPTPINPPDTNASKTPDVQPNDDANDAGAAQPPAQAPLPPGQGTRVNQLA